VGRKLERVRMKYPHMSREEAAAYRARRLGRRKRLWLTTGVVGACCNVAGLVLSVERPPYEVFLDGVLPDSILLPRPEWGAAKGLGILLLRHGGMAVACTGAQCSTRSAMAERQCLMIANKEAQTRETPRSWSVMPTANGVVVAYSF
jgi:hypothetical protein